MLDVFGRGRRPSVGRLRSGTGPYQRLSLSTHTVPLSLRRPPPAVAQLFRAGSCVVARGAAVRLLARSWPLCWSAAAGSEASLDRKGSLELIRHLVPGVFRGALLDSLSGRALSAAALAASFTLEGRGAPAASICSVTTAHQPGRSPAAQAQASRSTSSSGDSGVPGPTRLFLRSVQTHQAYSSSAQRRGG